MACDWLLVDGSSLIFRAFHGVPRTVRSPDGRPVNAVRGFLDTLARLVSTRQPRHLAVASDEDWRPAWRVELIPAYKAHRTAEPVPPDLEPQMPIIHDVLAALGIDFIGVPEYEAEDVIATWTATTPGSVEIVSGDRDLFALIEDPRVCVLYPEKAGLAVVTEAEVTRRYGVPGRSYADFAILRGDPSDGLPGLKGVGAVAAVDLVRRHGGVAGVLRDGRLTDQQRDYLTRAMRVVPPVQDLAVELPAGRREGYPVDGERLAALAGTHGLGSSVDRLVQALTVTLLTPPR
ncbi:MAG TPA: 5'-3' exonuclease [Candidatus Dormibacteraeota bacterium]|nr:5'-3' exonuclease [Candidatus Dormibacteraeota bacterium]